MLLDEFIKENPNKRIILLWFGKNNELQTSYCYTNKLSEQQKRMLAMEVMDIVTNEDEDWTEVWLR